MEPISSNSSFTTEAVCLASQIVAENPPIPWREIERKVNSTNENRFCGITKNPLASIQKIAQLT